MQDDDPLQELLIENEQLRRRLAIECMDATEEDKLLAHNLIAELQATISELHAEIAVLKGSRNSCQQENAELKRQCAAMRKRITGK